MKLFPLRALRVSLDIQSKALEDLMRQHRSRQSEIEGELQQCQADVAAAHAEMQRVISSADREFNVLVVECASEWMHIADEKMEISNELLRSHLIEIDQIAADLNSVRGKLSVVERKQEAWLKEMAAIALKSSEREIDELFSARRLAC